MNDALQFGARTADRRFAALTSAKALIAFFVDIG